MTESILRKPCDTNPTASFRLLARAGTCPLFWSAVQYDKVQTSLSARLRKMSRILESEVAMSAITITLPDERLVKLKKIAANLGVTPEELVRLSVEELLTRPDQAFQQAIERVLKKNKELYGRLV